MNKVIAFLSLIVLPLFGEQTLSLIKPDAVEGRHIGEIIALFEANGLQVAALKMTRMDKSEAEEFYIEHKGKPFYDELVKFMSRKPLVAIVLDGNDAVKKNRELMGATNPKEAKTGTIRAQFAKSKSENAVHGSDSKESALREIKLLFAPEEIVNGN